MCSVAAFISRCWMKEEITKNPPLYYLPFSVLWGKFRDGNQNDMKIIIVFFANLKILQCKIRQKEVKILWSLEERLWRTCVSSSRRLHSHLRSVTTARACCLYLEDSACDFRHLCISQCSWVSFSQFWIITSRNIRTRLFVIGRKKIILQCKQTAWSNFLILDMGGLRVRLVLVLSGLVYTVAKACLWIFYQATTSGDEKWSWKCQILYTVSKAEGIFEYEGFSRRTLYQ